MPATGPEPRMRPPTEAAGPTMRALLASCAAAEAISRPPSEQGRLPRRRAGQPPSRGAGNLATSHDAPAAPPAQPPAELPEELPTEPPAASAPQPR